MAEFHKLRATSSHLFLAKQSEPGELKDKQISELRLDSASKVFGYVAAVSYIWTTEGRKVLLSVVILDELEMQLIESDDGIVRSILSPGFQSKFKFVNGNIIPRDGPPSHLKECIAQLKKAGLLKGGVRVSSFALKTLEISRWEDCPPDYEIRLAENSDLLAIFDTEIDAYKPLTSAFQVLRKISRGFFAPSNFKEPKIDEVSKGSGQQAQLSNSAIRNSSSQSN